jgi:hypothetical protein
MKTQFDVQKLLIETAVRNVSATVETFADALHEVYPETSVLEITRMFYVQLEGNCRIKAAMAEGFDKAAPEPPKRATAHPRGSPLGNDRTGNRT